MKRVLLLLCLSVVVSLSSSTQTFASSAVQPSDEELIIGARAIVSGEVVEISTAVQNGIVFSYIRLQVAEVWKGEIRQSDIVLKQPGGEAGDLGTLIYGMPRFEVGKRVLVYLDTWADGALRVHQWFLGKYDITEDQVNRQTRVAREQSESLHVLKQEGTVATLTDSLDSYREMVKRLLKQNRKRARAFEQATYGDTPILAEPIEFASLHTGGQVVPQWVSLNPSRPPRWFEADSNQSVTFYVNGDGAPVNTVVDDVAQALNAWSQQSGANIRLNVSTTSGCGMQSTDGQNTIFFNNCDNYFSASPGCSGVLGVGGIIRYTPSQSKTVGGMTFYKAVEANVSINPYALCQFRNRCDLIEVLTHEIGHALGLGHSDNPEATMYSYAQFDNRCSTMFGDDLEGIRYLYPAGGQNSDVTIRTAADLPQVQAGQNYYTRLEATGGSGSYTWSLVGGGLPAGITLNTDGTLSGVTSEVCAANFIAQARDTAGRSSQMPFALPVQISNAVPMITGAEFRKKKVTIYGANFTPSGAVYLNDALVYTFVEANKLTTLKTKLKAGTHSVVVRDSLGRESNRFTFSVY